MRNLIKNLLLFDFNLGLISVFHQKFSHKNGILLVINLAHFFLDSCTFFSFAYSWHPNPKLV